MVEIKLNPSSKVELPSWNYLLKDKATFKGGEDSLLNFYIKHSKYEIISYEIVDINIFYKLTIDKKGKPLGVKITKSPSEEHSKELKRLGSIMPNWKPAKKDCKLVKVSVSTSLTMRIK